MEAAIIPPSRLSFWRLTLAVTSLLALLSVWQLLELSRQLEIAVPESKSWLAMLGALGLVCLGGLAGIGLSFHPSHASRFEQFDIRVPGQLRWLALPALVFFLIAYPGLLSHPYYGALVAKEQGVRAFLFWVIALGGTGAVRIVWRKPDWPAAFGAVLLGQAFVHLLVSHASGISNYPFALGWSETSRYYYPALFLSQKIFGQPQPWPILHPTLHLALAPPYLLEAPLVFHRAWQVILRFLLVGLIVPALLQHLKIQKSSLRWFTGLWIFLFLLDLPLYLHLAVPVILMLWGFSAHNERRTWLALAAASIWAGLSRLNWYPVPGMLAAALYLLEVPYENKGWRYLIKPALWCAAGTTIAFASMQGYIQLSGIPSPGDFYTSLSSTLLWYRLWPNASFGPGVLPGIVLFSLPLWLVIGTSLRQRRSIHPLRLSLLGAELLVLFAGGILVSMKIGGGADLHNMDAYSVLLLVVTACLFFNRYQPEAGAQSSPAKIHWAVAALLILIPAWFGQRATPGFVAYDPAAASANLSRLQARVDAVNATDGQILFITQRHLISMHMLKGVTLIPEYEREELMEMAMANNRGYLAKFSEDLKNHRFAAIIVDPLRFTQVGWKEAMGAENNAWARRVVKPVLCYYEQAEAFPEDRIVIYIPRQGEAQCP